MKINNNFYSDYTTFIGTCNKIFEVFSKSDVAFSPILSISKPIPEVIKKKQKTIQKVTKEKYYSYIITFIPRIFINLFVSILHHFYHLHYCRQFSFKKFAKTEIIFVSHYTGQETIVDEDPYFGKLSQQLNENKRPNLLLYINHNKGNPSNFYYETDTQKSNHEQYILPKTVSTKELLKLYKSIFGNFKEIMVHVAKKGERSKREKILMLELAIQQLGLESISQIILAKNIEQIVGQTNAKKMILTYEGHSFETYVANKLKNKFPNLDVSVYQFAPVVPAQNSFFRNLHYLNKNIRIFVSGSQFKENILRRTKLPSSALTVIGSRKNRTDKLSFTGRKDVTILFAAEGSRESLVEFINLAFDSSLENPGATFIVRAHPASTDYKLELFKKAGKFSSNFYLSRESLINDLHKATHCVYRSSSVGLEGLMYGVVPIHFGEVINFGLDPIDTIDLPHLQFTDAVALNQKIIELSNNYVEIDEQQLRIYKKVFNGYFEPLHLGILNQNF
jgi:hypothetical protein